MIGKKFTVKMSQDGKDVRVARPEEYTFDSDIPSLKTKITADPKHNDVVPYTFVSEPPAGETVMFKIKHNYEYTPGILTSIGDPSASFILNRPDTDIPYFRTPFRRSLDFETGSLSDYIVSVDRHYLYFIVSRFGTSWNSVKGTTVYVKYTILDIKGI